jgi:hypothetical protein
MKKEVRFTTDGVGCIDNPRTATVVVEKAGAAGAQVEWTCEVRELKTTRVLNVDVIIVYKIEVEEGAATRPEMATAAIG